MRYVRTEEDEVFDTSKEGAPNTGCIDVNWIIVDNNLICYSKRDKSYICNHGKIVKQSDDLRDLCDCFVRVFSNKWNPIILTDENDKTLIGNDHTDYGAVWGSDNRLRPALKIIMKKNKESGVLELL